MHKFALFFFNVTYLYVFSQIYSFSSFISFLKTIYEKNHTQIWVAFNMGLGYYSIDN
jgi:hypothetical protein